MAKIDYKKLRNELYKRTERYAEGVRILYDQALSEIAREFADVDYNHDEVFSFEGMGKFDKIDAIMRRLESQIEKVVEKGVVSEFGEAYNGCNELVKEVVGERLRGNVEKAFMPRVSSSNAAKAFIKANRAGSITASQRVWNGPVLGQMETAVEEALMDGTGAKRMAKMLEEYLVDPDICFRRFRIKTGVDADGKSMYCRKWKKRIIHKDGSTTWKDADPRKYGPQDGIGCVYHSSYKNALRYARTTTNIAYRTADHDRYQELPFVIGIEIKTSNNHPIKDICDELAGVYPKQFRWTGWHPNCRCYQVPVLASKGEVDEMVDTILDGGDADDVRCDEEVTELPENFIEWMQSNADRYLGARKRGTTPYFLRDNLRFANAGLNNAATLDDVIDEQIIGMSQSERKSIIKDIRELRHSAFLFSDVDIHITIDALPFGRMMTYDDGKLMISNKEFTFSDGAKYCPAKALQSAFKKLKAKEELNFYEEYSVETLFHESVHSRKAHRWGGDVDAKIYEICTQLYARENYPAILTEFGVKAVNQVEIRRNGLGYSNGCDLLRRFFMKDNVVNSQQLMAVLLSENTFDSLMKIVGEFNLSQSEIRQLFKNLC